MRTSLQYKNKLRKEIGIVLFLYFRLKKAVYLLPSVEPKRYLILPRVVIFLILDSKLFPFFLILERFPVKLIKISHTMVI